MDSSRRPLTKVLALGRGVRNRWRQSFVASISLVALLGVAAFALVIGRIVEAQIEDQAFDRAKDTAQITARASFAPRLPADGRPLSRRDLADLDRQLAAAREREPAIDMRMWSRDGTVLYARERSLIGRQGNPSSTVKAALTGRSATAVRDARSEPVAARPAEGGSGESRSGKNASTDGGGPLLQAAVPIVRHRGGPVLETAVPIVRRRGGPVAAALELTLPYGPIAADVRDRRRRLWLALGIVALLAYALALPGLLRAGRALRSQYDPRRVQLVRELRRALERDELELRFQPIAEAAGGRVHGVEALVRWRHPRDGLVSPDRFISAIEGTDVIGPLTVRVFELALRQCRRWRDEGRELRMAVNVSGAVLPDRRLPGEIERLLEACGVPAEVLEIEVTEGAVMEDAGAAAGVLGRLTDMGVGVIAIDDFGTGYSSLARLHELPLDTLKIDQSFVMRMAKEGDDTVVRSIVELAHALGLSVIAEGVEDEDTWAALAALGCDFVQGYALTRPLSGDGLSEWLEARVPSDAWPSSAT